MYNRYVGNTGRVIRVDEEPVVFDRPLNTERPEHVERDDVHRRRTERVDNAAIPPRGGGGLSALFGGGKSPFGGGGGGLSALFSGGKGLFGGGKGLFGGGGGGLRFLDNVLPFGMDTGDLALIVLFFFLYLESGDDEFLIIMAFLAYSIFTERPDKPY